MSLWVIIPVKPLSRAKSRLSEVLSPEQRYQFAATMLRHMLSVVTDVSQVAGVLVISRDTKALAIARDMGAKTLQESNPSDLNPALMRATEVVRIWGADAVLNLPADLPFVTRGDVATIADLGQDYNTVVLASDREQNGTNALLVRPAGLITYKYGENSFNHHITAAKMVGATIHYYESPTIALDIDIPDDLNEYNRLVANGNYSLLTPFLPDVTPE